MADLTLRHFLRNVAVALAVQHEMADKSGDICLHGHLLFPGCRHDQLLRPLKKGVRILIVHLRSQLVHLVGVQRLIIKQNIGPVQADMVKGQIILDPLL